MSQDELTVIGAGLAGLTTALLAARAGLRVTLWTGRGPGGRARTDVVAGNHLNQGAHALYDGGVAARTWRELGIPAAGAPPSFPFFGSRHGRLRRLPTDALSLASTGLLGVVDKARFAAILTRLEADAARLAPETTWSTWRRSKAADGTPLASLLDALARLSTFIADPGPVRASLLLRQMALSNVGITYVDGGWQRIVEDLLAACADAGVTLVGSTAQGVDRDGDRFVVRGRDTSTSSDALVLAVGPTATARLLGTEAPVLPTVRACALDVALSHLPAPEVPFVLDLDAPRYLSVHSAVADLAAPDQHVVHVVAYGESTREETEGFLERWQPGWQEHVVAARWRPAMVVQHRMPAVDAPRVPVELGPGLFQVGDHCGEGFLSDAAVQSALDAVDALTVRQARRHAG